MKRFVILDLETTGVSYSKGDRIIQVAYQVIEDNETVKQFNSFIHSNKDIPSFIGTLTGISRTDLTDAPAFDEVAPEILKDLEQAYFVAHNVEFDLNFLNAALEDAGYMAFQGPVLDTVELARICFPTEESYRLVDLADKFSAVHLQPHQADSDVEATRVLFNAVMDRLKGLPEETLQHLITLSTFFKSDVTGLLETYADQTQAFGYERHRGLALKLIDTSTNSSIERNIGADESSLSFLDNEAQMSKVMTDFEIRSSQYDMMTFVENTFQNNQIGLVEAGTGTGKTLAYLIPAVIQAVKNEKPTVISTETIQLQSQMLNKEWPVIQALFPFPVRAALLKGRSHYLCLQKFENLLREDPNANYDRSIAKAQLLIWLLDTDTGDVEEVNLASTHYRFWMDVSSDGVSCTTPKCPWFSRDYYQRARKNARTADIIITNHSLLLTDIRLSHQIIPSYETLVLDEAHHLEDTATRQFGVQLDYLAVIQLINSLNEKEQHGFLSPELKKRLSNEIMSEYQEVQQTAERLYDDWNTLFIELHQYGKKGQGDKIDTPKRSKIIQKEDEHWMPVQKMAQEVDVIYRRLISTFRRILVTIEEEALDQGFLTSNERDIENLTTAFHAVEEQYSAFHDLLIIQDENHVIWLETEDKGKRHAITLRSAPVDVSDTLADELFAKNKRMILTSATMTVKSSFGFMIDRLGLEDFDVTTLQLPSPFDYEKQAALFVPTDMPMIQGTGERAYIDACAYHLYRISEVTEGRMLVLFTSYDMLRKTYYTLRNMLDESYMLIAQGVQSASRQKLTKNFQQFDRAILFGTSSFWEGVDIPGDHLSAIVMVRLPFSPPNDPVFKARSDALKDKGGNPFMHLALPQAVLRFKQGFGRLIRKSTDRGAVIVLDRRIVTTRYGHFFAKSLQGIQVREESMDIIEEQLPKWINPVKNEQKIEEEPG
ncbi:ATP-dependent DNA helicase DinG [Salisediminibacterium beveridgei]|uniref:3'-5' exonuclease DinG n=1 Tax=Salisediminibacterium beveridgei TaxID=632773 RepID=A0A1D7QV11_9BACI|nr:ATP-dependent DNA helicase DinG [Salisediminibacterium beveridgei]AOM82837.1 DinG family ATP-dependent helicase YoaA [Salisediminibacterium beveridgei]